jgi:DNA polymerase III psi subunit
MEEESPFKTTYTEEVYSIPPPPTVVLGSPWNELKQEQQILLSKILQSVKLSLDAVRIVHQTTLDLSCWNEKPHRLLAFVAPPKGVSLYEIIQTGETAVIFADPLEVLHADDGSKRKLWNALKSLYTS